MEKYSGCLMLLATAISIPLAVHTWRRRGVPGAVPLMVMVCGIIVWTASAGLFLLDAYRGAILISAVELMGIAMIPPAWLSFSLHFTGRKERSSKKLIFASIVACLAIFFLTLTNDWHHWVWRYVERNGGLRWETWIAYWIFVAYTYTLCLVGLAIVLERAFSAPSVFRRQCWILVFAWVVPIATYPIYSLKIIEIPFDPTPLGFLVTIVLIWWALFRYQLLDLRPVSHSILMDSLRDGLLVIDRRERILEMNRSARDFFSCASPETIGLSVEEAIPIWRQIQSLCKLETDSPCEVEVQTDGETVILEVRSTPLLDKKGNLSGFLIVFRDITALRNALNEVKILSGLIPICSHCKNIRDDRGYWQKVEEYIATYTDFTFSHSICPECVEKHYPHLHRKMSARHRVGDP